MSNEVKPARKDLVWDLAGNVVRLNFQDLPPEVVDAAKKGILDTIGVITAASGITPGLREIADLVKRQGGVKESTILGFGGKVPACMAAFANGAMSHCLDYDDLQYTAMGHLSAQTVPAAFAVAESLGNVSGKEFIAAIALANDVMARLCYSVSFTVPWHRNPVFGVFAAACASGKLLKLNLEQMVDAMGLAFLQSAGTEEMRFEVGSDIGGMRDCFPNKGGVLSALLAKAGIKGVRTCFEGHAGLYNVYYAGQYNRDIVVKDLGKKWIGADVGFKAWPACGATHSYIDPALDLVREHVIKPEDVAEITVFIGDLAKPLCEPLEARRHPPATMDAKYSIPFSTAVALAHKNVTLRDFFVENLKDPVIIGLAEKVTPKFDPAYNRSREHRAGRVDVRMKDGTVYSKRSEFPYGHPTKPMSWDDIKNKFRDCLSHSAKPIPAANVEKAISMITGLDSLDDMRKLARLLA